MGFFDIFRKKPKIAPDELVINVMEHSLIRGDLTDRQEMLISHGISLAFTAM